VLSLIGGALGVALAYAGLSVVVATGANHAAARRGHLARPRGDGVCCRVSLFSSLLFGALPALKHAHSMVPRSLAAARGASASRERQRTRNALVVVQVALALVLLVASGLMIRTFVALLDVEPGFAAAADVQTARVWVPPQQVPEPERVTRMQQEILDKIAALPGVKAAAFASAVPMEGPVRVWLNPVFVEGRTTLPGTTPPMRRMKVVSPGYFAAIGTRMIAGRDITVERHLRTVRRWRSSPRTSPAKSGDRRPRRWVTRIRDSCSFKLPTVWREIVGVVENVQEDALYQAAPTFVVLAGHDGELRRQHAVRRCAPINLVIRSDEAGRESLFERRPQRRVVGQLEHARLSRSGR
jgi:hypothetical protein